MIGIRLNVPAVIQGPLFVKGPQSHNGPQLYHWHFPPLRTRYIWGAVTKALWSDLGRCIVCQVNNAVQKIAFSLSDRHQIVPGGGGGRHKAFLSAENWKAFIKWLSLVKCLFSFFLSFVFFEEEEEEPPFVSTLNSVSLCSACSTRECWHM